ncbi:MAG: BON domain-containing protein [Azospirillaceae bacterium]
MILAAGTTAGLAVAEERSVGEQMSDASIKLRLNALWLEEMPDRYMDLGATVVERRVLVTGTVPTPEDRVEAIRLAWAVDGVRSVVNRVEVADSDGLGGFLRDSWISAQIESRLTFDTAVFSVNYTVDTVRGTVYLMGIAQDAEERRRVVGHARQVPYVRRIVDLTRLKGEPPPVPGTPPGDAGAIAAGASGSGSADSATSAVERRPLE